MRKCLFCWLETLFNESSQASITTDFKSSCEFIYNYPPPPPPPPWGRPVSSHLHRGDSLENQDRQEQEAGILGTSAFESHSRPEECGLEPFIYAHKSDKNDQTILNEL